jgi:predicted XRE-type DNA-binding protein
MRLTAKFENLRTAPTPKRDPHPDVSSSARNLALAHRIAALIEQGQIADYTAAARLLGVSQPRLTHLMGLLLLAPEIQAAILAGTIAPGDKQLRQLARVAEWPAQIDMLSRFTATRRSPRTSKTTSPLPQTATARSTSDD